MHSKRIELQSRLDWPGTESFIADCHSLLKDEQRFQKIVIGMRSVVAVTPMGLAVLAATMLKLKMSRAYEIGIYEAPADPKLRAMLERMNFKLIINEPEKSLLCSVEQMVNQGGLVFIREERDCAKVAQLLVEFLTLTTSMSSDVRKALEFCLPEVAENAFRHSESGGAIVCAQRLSNQRVELAVVDTGIGLRESFRNTDYFASMADDVEAIKCALRAGVTSKPSRHSGVGLFFARKILVATRGDFLLYSHYGKCRFEGPRCSCQKVPYWPGTVVAMRLRPELDESVADVFSRYRTEADVMLELDI
jgi:anti-sigma regulatory factor (Ser/Thr protein kinase)